MCTTINVNRTAVLTAYRNGSESSRETLQILFGKDLFNQKITEQVKTFEDALAITGEDWCPPQGMTSDELAYRKLKIIAKALNEGWTPDWSNRNEYKYTVWAEIKATKEQPGGVGFVGSGCGTWHTITNCGSRLCYKSSELALYAGKQFEELYKDFFLIR